MAWTGSYDTSLDGFADQCHVTDDVEELVARTFVVPQEWLVDQNAPKDFYIIRKKIEITDDNGSNITILPDEEFSITAMCSFNSKFIPGR